MPIKSKFVQVVTVIDPDSNMPVEVEIRKLETGPMMGVDGSYLEQDVGPIYSPYDARLVIVPDDEAPPLKMIPRKVRDTLTIVGRRWFNKRTGNTYHSATIIVDGQLAHVVPYAYGYGDQYLDSALAWLKENGYIDPPMNGREAIWRWAERVGVVFTYNVSDVGRKKDL